MPKWDSVLTAVSGPLDYSLRSGQLTYSNIGIFDAWSKETAYRANARKTNSAKWIAKDEAATLDMIQGRKHDAIKVFDIILMTSSMNNSP